MRTPVPARVLWTRLPREMLVRCGQTLSSRDGTMRMRARFHRIRMPAEYDYTRILYFKMLILRSVMQNVPTGDTESTAKTRVLAPKTRIATRSPERVYADLVTEAGRVK